MKNIVGIITVVLAFVAYAPYIRDTITKKTKPHIYSWFVWGFITSIIFVLQVSAGAGPGSYVTLSVAVLSFVIVGLGLRNGTKYITIFDTICFSLALIATGIWLFAEESAISMTILVSADIFGFLPTIRKAWNKPDEETLFTWGLNGARHALSIVAIASYSFVTLLNPVAWTVANAVFSGILIARRSYLKGR